jgi:hypothetical protein
VGPVSYIYGTLKIPCGFRESRDRQGQISRPFLARRFSPSLIEGSVSVRAVRGFPERERAARSEWFGAIHHEMAAHSERFGAPLRRSRGLCRYGCPWR